MRNLYWLTDEQMERLRRFFSKSHGTSHCFNPAAKKETRPPN